MSDDELICPVCERGHLTPQTYSEDFTHNGETLRVDGLEGYLCDTCGADPVFPDQIRRGHAKIQDARRRADGLLTGGEIRAFRKRFKLTQQQAAKIFGGGSNAFSKYERGDVVQSVAMDRFMRVCIRHPGLVEELAADAGVTTSQESVSTDYVTYKEGSIKAAALERQREACPVVSLESYRRRDSKRTPARTLREHSVESSDWEEA